MALDPSISLGVKSFAPAPGAFQDYAMNQMKMAQMAQGMQAQQQQIAASQQEVEASRAAQAQTEAGTPGVAAQSQSLQAKALQDQQDAAAMQYATSIAPKYTRHNQDGSTTFDSIGAGNDMASQGFIKQGGAAIKSWMDGISSSADATKKLQDNTAELHKAQLIVSGPLLNQAARIADPVERQKFLDDALDRAEASYPAIFPKGTTTNMEQLFERAKVDPVGAASFSMTPDKWIAQDIEQKNADTGRINALSGQINASTGALAQKIGVVGAVSSGNTDAALYDNGVAAVNGLRDPKTGKLPENIATLRFDKLSNMIKTDPALSGLNGAIQKAQADGQTIDYSGGYEGIQQQLRLLAQTKKDAVRNLTATQAQGGRALPTTAPAAPTSGIKPPGAVTPAPAAALKALKDHPERAAEFKAKFGYLPGQ